MNCELCNILSNEQFRIVFENEHAFVVVILEPIKDGHLMVMPKRHAEELSDLTPEEAQSFLMAADNCLHGLENYQKESTLFTVNGKKNRSQKHLHAHVVPSRHAIRELFALAEGTPERQRANDKELQKMADDLRPFIS
ncbi:MAG: HIT domain-containing protein [Patescibacteria group bacterium]